MNTVLDRLDTRNARLPRNYEAAKQALETTHAIDECQDWADKAAALASYARQASDDGLQKLAMRIQGRAVRRAGELLREIEDGQGSRTDRLLPGAEEKLTKAKAAKDAGMSKRQRDTAIRVAGIPEDEFEEAIESDDPPTVTKLASGRKDPDADKVREMYGDAPFEDPEAFSAGIHLAGAVSLLLKQFENSPSINRMVDTMRDHAKRDLRRDLSALAEPMAELMHQLGE